MTHPYHHPLLALAAALVLFDGANLAAQATSPPRAPTAPIVVLEPFVVKDQPITSFGIALNIEVDRATGLVRRLIIRSVDRESEAYTKNLRAGMEILEVDELTVVALPARFEPGSEFNRRFMHRQKGDHIELTVAGGPNRETRVVGLTQGVGDEWRPWVSAEHP